MGLTIHWTLKNPLNAEAIHAKVLELHSACLDLPFASVDEVCRLNRADIERIRTISEHPLSWAMIQAEQSVVRATGGQRCWLSVPPEELIGFSTWPGEGCEEANFFIGRYPRLISHEGQRIETGLDGWCGRSFCKTQYASTLSVPHFLRCHLTVIAMLDRANELGSVAEVSDEGDYWTKRDIPALAREVGEWNEMIAGIVGAFDAKGLTMISPITQHPQFELLEHRGLQSATTALAAKKLAEIAKRLSP